MTPSRTLSLAAALLLPLGVLAAPAQASSDTVDAASPSAEPARFVPGFGGGGGKEGTGPRDTLWPDPSIEEDPLGLIAACLDSETLGDCVNCCLDEFLDDPGVFYVCVEECSDSCDAELEASWAVSLDLDSEPAADEAQCGMEAMASDGFKPGVGGGGEEEGPLGNNGSPQFKPGDGGGIEDEGPLGNNDGLYEKPAEDGPQAEDPKGTLAACLDSDTLGECVNCCLDGFLDDPGLFYVCVEECSLQCDSDLSTADPYGPTLDTELGDSQAEDGDIDVDSP